MSDEDERREAGSQFHHIEGMIGSLEKVETTAELGCVSVSPDEVKHKKTFQTSKNKCTVCAFVGKCMIGFKHKTLASILQDV